MSTSYKEFSFTVPFGMDQYVHEIGAGDFNGDGLLDLVFTAFYYPIVDEKIPIRIALGTEAGGFVESTAALFDGPIPGTVHPRQISIADFNGDGVDDIFIADHGTDNDPRGAPNLLLLSDGLGKLVDSSATLPMNGSVAPDTGHSGGFTHSVAAADVDGDGDIDIYVGNIWGSQTLPPHLLINDGAGGFTIAEGAIDPALGNLSRKFTSVLFHDMDRDGAVDLVLGGHDGAPNRIYWNDGSGDFSGAYVDLPAGPFSAFDGLDLARIDLNGDGLPDLAIQMVGPGYQGHYVQLLVNQGGRTFADETAARLSQPNYETDPWNSRITAADVDTDGDTDLVSYGSKPILYRNDGYGTFLADPDFLGVPEHSSTIVFDLNRDAVPDLVHFAGGTATALMSQRTGAVQHGNDVDNVLIGGLETNLFYGNGGNDKLYGGEGADFLFGGDGDDLLDGGTNPETREGGSLTGGQGDWMYGGAGNDIYYVDSPLDLAIESALLPDVGYGGFDAVISTADIWADYFSFVDLVIIAEQNPHAISAVIHGSGDGLLVGNGKTNIFYGLGGAVTYRAGDGIDYIVLTDFDPAFDAPDTVVVERSIDGGSWDIVFGFGLGKDRIDLTGYGFPSREEAVAGAASDGAVGTYVILGDGADVLYLVDVAIGDLGQVDFIV